MNVQESAIDTYVRKIIPEYNISALKIEEKPEDISLHLHAKRQHKMWSSMWGPTKLKQALDSAGLPYNIGHGNICCTLYNGKSDELGNFSLQAKWGADLFFTPVPIHVGGGPSFYDTFCLKIENARNVQEVKKLVGIVKDMVVKK